VQAKHFEEGDAVLQRTDADHGVQIFGHGVFSVRVEYSWRRGRWVEVVKRMVRMAVKVIQIN
jgi:hypothetical protein